jgi:hypothetical protein
VSCLVASACGGDDTETGEADPNAAQSSTTTVPDDADDGDDDDGDSSSTTTTTSTEPVALTASWTGVTEDTIRLGFTTSDLVELKRIGLVDIDRGDPQVVLDAIIADINDRGGINGRMVEGHLEVLLPIDPVAAEASCVRLTEDVGVFAVLAPFVGLNTEVNLCINDLHETVIVGGQPTPEQLESSKAPWISNTMFSDRRLRGVVQLLEDEGLLGDTVGVVVTAEEEAAATDVVIPALDALGKDVVDAVLDVPQGDTQAGAAAWRTFIERFAVEGVDSVVMVENTGTFGASQLAASDLDAEYLIVDSAQLVGGLGALGVLDPAELAGVIGSGTASAEESWELAATQDCVRAFEQANPDIEVVPSADVPDGGSDWLGNIMIFCAPLRLFELAATAAGSELTHESFLTGAEGLGDIDIPGQLFASMGPGKHGAADAVRLTEFDPTIGEDGGATPFGPLMRID